MDPADAAELQKDGSNGRRVPCMLCFLTILEKFILFRNHKMVQDYPNSPWHDASSYTKADFKAFCRALVTPVLSTGANGSGDLNYGADPEQIVLASDDSIHNSDTRNDDVVLNDSIDDVKSADFVPNKTTTTTTRR